MSTFQNMMRTLSVQNGAKWRALELSVKLSVVTWLIGSLKVAKECIWTLKQH